MAEKHLVLLNKLQDETSLKELFQIFVDFVIDRPLKDFFDPNSLAKELTTAIKKSAGNTQNHSWLKAETEKLFHESKDVVPEKRAKDLVPPKWLESAKKLAAEPLVIDQKLAHDLVDHRAFRGILREILTQTLLDFSSQITSILPGGKVMSGIMGFAKELAKSEFGGIADQIESKVKTAVEDALTPSVSLTAKQLSNHALVDDLSSWRQHVIEVIANRRLSDINDATIDVSAEAFSQSFVDSFAALATWNDLEPNLASFLNLFVDKKGDLSVRQALGESTLIEDFTPYFESYFLKLAKPFFESEQFSNWLKNVLDE